MASPLKCSGEFDARAVANLLLDVASGYGLAIRHIKLQKLLYFAHGVHLIQSGKPLISGHFEAWQRGPVHPAVYRSFRGAGADPISFRAQREDVMTGARHPLPSVDAPFARIVVDRVVSSLGQMPDFALVELSHVQNGPWQYVVEKMKGGIALGARIDDDCIRARFFRHKWVVRLDAAPGEGLVGAKLGDNNGDVEKPITSAY